MLDLHSLFEKSISSRAPHLSPETNALRLFDGSGDGLSDYALDQYGRHWLLSTKRGILPEELTTALESLGDSVYWKKLDHQEKESPALLVGEPAKPTFMVRESGLHFEISFETGYSQGLFLDQRLNRVRVREELGSGQRLLNTFAYTGAFSVAGAAAGAVTTTLDLSQPYLDWAKRNLQHNGFSPEEHYFCKGDTFHWLERFAKSGKTFHGIVLDPPTFSRDAKGKVFRAQRDYHRLASLAAALLEPGGWILACTNCRQMSGWEFEEQLSEGFPTPFQLEALPMPPEYSDTPYLKSYWCTPS